MYDAEALERGIEQCKQNIQVFEDAIDKERETIREYRSMIDKLEEKRQNRANMIVVEVSDDGEERRIT